MKKNLVVRDRKFVNLMGLHDQHYDGHAFFQRKDGIVRLPVDSRIVVDAERFRKSNPSYPRLFTQKPSSSVFFDLGSATEQADSERVKSKGVAPGDLDKYALLICAPTVLAFSLGDKFWGDANANMTHNNRANSLMVGKFAVEDIRPIHWPSLPMACLTVAAAKKEVLMAVAQRHLGRLHDRQRLSRTTDTFDDAVEGKGRESTSFCSETCQFPSPQSMLTAKSGPPGIGKTLSAGALSEHFRRTPYSVCI